jgi:hypothetical protein
MLANVLAVTTEPDPIQQVVDENVDVKRHLCS